jgi:citrate/tricarballylate utilization protein
VRATETAAEARRVMEICNACRYCEGYCAVFPAMELRRAFSEADLAYLANLCHDCRGCYHACQYAPPHEFGINLPRTFASLRAETYADYAWPRALAKLFQHNGRVVWLLTVIVVAAVLASRAGVELGVAQHGRGAFYRIVPLGAIVAAGSASLGYAIFALLVGGWRFWRDTGVDRIGAPSLGRAVSDVLTLRNLGGGAGCNDIDESFSNTRRWLHHATFYGFLLCFAATCVAFVYHHLLGWIAPYPLLSVPVLLGTIGGAGLLAGTTGLFAMKLRADPAPAARHLLGMDTALLILLWLISATGLLLLAVRATGAMGALLCIHFGLVLALFLVLPYGKFVHAVYRAAALLRAATERAP